MTVKVGQIYRSTDSRRKPRQIRVGRTTKTRGEFYALVSSKTPGGSWVIAPAIRLDRLMSRAYKLVKS